MGQLIYLESYQLAQAEKAKRKIFRAFPWEEVKSEYEFYFEPIIRFWSDQRRLIIYEAFTRLIYEAFSLGYKEKKGNSDIIDYEKKYSSQFEALIQQIMQDFGIHQWLNDWKCESITILFEHLTKQWFVKGLHNDS